MMLSYDEWLKSNNASGNSLRPTVNRAVYDAMCADAPQHQAKREESEVAMLRRENTALAQRIEQLERKVGKTPRTGGIILEAVGEALGESLAEVEAEISGRIDALEENKSNLEHTKVACEMRMLEMERKADSLMQYLREAMALVKDGRAGKDADPALVECLERRIADLEQRPSLEYRGVYDASTAYVVGDVVTEHGSAWHCQSACQGQRPPGPAWKLMVKRGADGRDGGKNGKDLG